MSNALLDNLKLSPKQQENILFNVTDIRFELNEGTPRSGKTSSDAVKMAWFYLQTEDPSHLVLAYSQEQAFRMFVDGEGLGLIHTLGPLCTVKHDEHGDHLLITQPDRDNRQIKVYYKGGGKANAVGAITGLTLGSVVYLEYNLLHPEVIKETFRRTMVAKNRYHLAEQNPPAPNHPNLELYKQFEDSGQFHFRHWTPHDNPAFTQERLDEIYEQVKNSPYLLNRDWLGNRVLPEGVIYSGLDVTGDKPAHRIDKIPDHFIYIETYITADGGTSDATTCSVNQVYFYDGKYYTFRIANYYHSNHDTKEGKAMSDYAAEIWDFLTEVTQVDARIADYTTMFIDPACKALKLEIKKYWRFKKAESPRIKSADNNARDKARSQAGKDSLVATGIDYGRIIIANDRFALVDAIPDKLNKYGHDAFLKEAGLYVIDPKTKKPVDKYNHAMDDFRYSNNYFYKRYLKDELEV